MSQGPRGRVGVWGKGSGFRFQGPGLGSGALMNPSSHIPEQVHNPFEHRLAVRRLGGDVGDDRHVLTLRRLDDGAPHLARVAVL